MSNGNKKKRKIHLLLKVAVVLLILVVAAGILLPTVRVAQRSARRGTPSIGNLGPIGDYSGFLYPQYVSSSRLFRAPGEVPQAIPGPGEEVWVIVPAEAGQVALDEDAPGTGSLKAKLPDSESEVAVPLKHTDVKAHVVGYIGTVDVTQQFQNPYDQKIEAIYVFPLPANAAVNEFVMTVGDRKIRGIIREREEAEKIYKEAKEQGYVASLMTQERPNVFTQSVANIEPGKEIDISIRYFQTLAYNDGWYEFVFPMVVGPRFNPPGSTEGIGAVARGSHGASGQSTEVEYLKPGERSGHDISLSVNIEAGVKIESLQSPSHGVEIDRSVPHLAKVRLSPFDSIPNKDFVLRFKVAGDAIKSDIFAHHDERGGFFTLMVYPPEDLKNIRRAPMEMVFVLDCSGSMNGVPIEIAKSAIERAVKKLQPGDTFQIIRFSVDASRLSEAPVPATPENIRKGLAYLKSLDGHGGTQMIEGIKAALDFPRDPQRQRVVSFMTDGYIGNEGEIFYEVSQRIGETRIFSFGVGSSVNRYLLEGLARFGRGAVAWIGLNEGTDKVVDAFYDRVSHPAMTDIAVDWGNLDAYDIYPQHVPDLFVGRPVILTGRYSGSGHGVVRISGNAGGEKRTIEVALDLDETGETHEGIAPVWARMKIADLCAQAAGESGEGLAGQVKQVALEYGLMSAYTAFIAVDSLTQTEGGQGVTIAVPVNVPEGVKYETTVTE
jgi:Ca-activated chloride channel family protein